MLTEFKELEPTVIARYTEGYLRIENIYSNTCNWKSSATLMQAVFNLRFLPGS